MNAEESKSLCKRVCTVEGKTWTVELSQAWHELLQGLDVEVADRATSLALQDHNIHTVGPKHVLGKVPAAVAQLNALLREGESSEGEWKSEPQPVCREHDLPIMKCVDCVDVLVHQVSHLYGDALHDWACRHLYRADSLVSS